MRLTPEQLAAAKETAKLTADKYLPRDDRSVVRAEIDARRARAKERTALAEAVRVVRTALRRPSNASAKFDAIAEAIERAYQISKA